MSAFDIDAIKRFCDGVSQNQKVKYDEFIKHKLSGESGITPKIDLCNGVSQSDIEQAAFVLSSLVYGGLDIKKELGIKNKSGSKATRLDQTIHSPEFSVVVSYVSGEIKHIEAVQILMSEFFVGKTVAEEFLRSRKQAAEKVLKITSVINKRISAVTNNQ